ncbi:MAG: hypothetical protein HOC05_01315, partial [Gemmatimonadetes bacterium]|nr:hypothetical protein [Gemmatimonadota bacterium]
MLIDADKVENPEALDPTSVEAMVYLRTLLPPEFQNVTCSYNLSASAGLSDSDRISGHLWFYLDRPVGQQELKEWLAGYPVDNHLFNTVHQHYVAAPVFSGELEDPVAVRKGLLHGDSDAVAVPETDISISTYSRHSGDGAGLQAARGYEAKMALMGDGEGKEGCHGVITPAIASYMTRRGPGADREALKADIRQRVAAAHWDRSKHPEDYIAHEVSDEVLDLSIQDWIDKAFVRGAGYEVSERDEPNVAREKIAGSVRRFVSSAERWQAEHDYRQALLEGRLRLYLDADGNPALAFDGEPGSDFMTFTDQSIRRMLPPPRHGLAAQVALGKTEAYLDCIPQLVATLRNGHCVLIVVPNHRLSGELRERARERGLDVEVYLGPAQADPAQAGNTMCWIPNELNAFQRSGVASKLCEACPHRQECGFQKQRRKKAQVWIGAHPIIFRKRAKPIPPVDYVIVDENALAGGIEGDDPQRPLLLLSGDVPDNVKQVLEQLPRGVPLKRKHFALGNGELHELARAAYANQQDVELPAMATYQDIADASKTALFNSEMVLQASFYRAIQNDGPWGMRAVALESKSVELRWLRHRKIHSDFDVPTLFADATLNEEAIEHLIDVERPPADVEEPWIDEDGSTVPAMDQGQPFITGPAVRVAAKTPHVAYRQILFSGAASKFKDDKTGANNVVRVRRYIEARSVGRREVLVICQLDLEKRLNELGLPPNVETAHFNAIRGQDRWRNVDLIVLIGRAQGKPAAMEMLAEARFHEEIKSLGPDYYERVWMPLPGTDVMVQTERHPDPHAEVVRWETCEGELIQSIGRGRGVNRTEENPLQVDLINLVPLPDIEIGEVVEWDDAQPDARAVIAGRYGVLLPSVNTSGMAPLIAA